MDIIWQPLDKLVEIDRVLQRCKLFKLTHVEIDNLKRTVTSQETELVRLISHKEVGKWVCVRW
jgi:hypothetical protein